MISAFGLYRKPDTKKSTAIVPVQSRITTNKDTHKCASHNSSESEASPVRVRCERGAIREVIHPRILLTRLYCN
jgi:hypothetical protein